MAKKLVNLFLVFFVFCVSNVFAADAVNNCSNTATDFLGYADFESGVIGNYFNVTGTLIDQQQTVFEKSWAGWSGESGAANIRSDHTLGNNNTVQWYAKSGNITGTDGGFMQMRTSGTSIFYIGILAGTSATNWAYYNGAGFGDSGTAMTGDWQEFKAYRNGPNWEVTIDGVVAFSREYVSANQFYANGGPDTTYWLDKIMTFSGENCPPITDPDTTPPKISDAICTSCTISENVTIDPTPTINVTCFDDDNSCTMVRIANSSNFNFSNASSTRDCVVGTGYLFICTLPATDSLTEFDQPTTLYFWSNDTLNNYHTVFNLSVNINLTQDVHAPTFNNQSDNTSTLLVGNTFHFNISISDNIALDTGIFSWNDSGTFVNFTYDLSGTHTNLIVNKTTTLNSGVISFRWFANDTSGNINFTDLKTFNVTPTFIELDGLGSNRTYEFETTANLSTNFNFIDVLDGTFRYVDETSPFLYYIDLLRINSFGSGNLSRNITNGGYDNITLNNLTDLFNTTINFTGHDVSGFPEEVKIFYNDVKVDVPGTWVVKDVCQDNFSFGGVSVVTENLSFKSAESKIVFVNFSKQGNLSSPGKLNFTITGFSLDSGNDFGFADNLTDNASVNFTNTFNIDIPTGVLDDFVNNVTGRWNMFSQSCSNQLWTPVWEPYPSDTWHCSDPLISSSNDCDGIPHTTVYSGGSLSFASVINQEGYCQQKSYSGAWTYKDTANLDNASFFNISAYRYCSATDVLASYASCSANIFFTDKTSSKDISSLSVSSPGEGTSSEGHNIVITGYKVSDTQWDVYNKDNFIKTVDVSTLGNNITIGFGIGVSVSGMLGATASGTWALRSFYQSGIWLRSEASGAYNLSGVFESKNLSNTTNDISRVLVTLKESNFNGTQIQLNVSNDDGASWEEATSGEFHTFVSNGKVLRVKFKLNTTVNVSSPVINGYSVQVIPTVMSNLSVDVGADGIIDSDYDFELNSTSTPIYYLGNDSAFTTYLSRNCFVDPCFVPIRFTSSSGGIIQVSDFNLTRNVNPIKLNDSVIETANNVVVEAFYANGLLQLDDIRFDFGGNKNITVFAHNGGVVGENRTIMVRYSPFDLSVPSGQTYWQLFPTRRNQSGITPFGQNSSVGFWEVNARGYADNIDVYVRYNESVDSCVTRNTFRGNDFSVNTSVSTHFYQEFASSTGNNTNWNGDTLDNLRDGIYDVHFAVSGQGDTSFYWVNYSVEDVAPQLNYPVANNRTLWQVYDTDNGLINLSVPTSCSNQVPLQFQVHAHTQIPVFGGNWSCWNGTDWDILLSSDSGEFHEEGVHWNVTHVLFSNNSVWSLNVTDLSTVAQPIIKNLNTTNVGRVWTFTDINCSGSSSAFIIPYFCFMSLCSDCVKTFDWDEDCAYLE